MNGYSGTKMDMIIAATGFTKGGIYRHFDSKMDLAKAAFRYNGALLHQIYFDGVRRSDSPVQQIKKFMDNYKKYITNPTIIGGCPILNTATEMDDIDEEFKLLVKSHLDNFAKKLVRIIKLGMEKGEFKKSIEPKKEVLLFIASIEGLFMIHGVYENTALVKDMCDSLFSSFEDIILA